MPLLFAFYAYYKNVEQYNIKFDFIMNVFYAIFFLRTEIKVNGLVLYFDNSQNYPMSP